MLTIDSVLKNGSLKLKNISTTPNLDAELIMCFVLEWERVSLIANKYNEISEQCKLEFENLISRRFSGEPVQYIIGFQEFMGLPFKVKEGVLIPRPDTEILVESVIGMVDPKMELKILEIGTGSGAIPISLAHYLKKAKFWTVDISEIAFSVAKENAQINHVENQITFLKGDLFGPVDSTNEMLKFDLIISNPPYIPKEEIEDLQIEVAKFEPRLALDGGEDGLDFYRRISNESVKYLSEDGIIVFEIGYNQANLVKSMLEKVGFEEIEVIKDLAGKDRVVIGRKE